MTERFGDYELITQIATGGMAEIHLARLSGVEGFSRNIVVKRMLPQLAARPDFVAMFLDEARLAANLQHPNIVQVFNLGNVSGSYFMAMELVDGPHLGALFAHSLRQRRPLPIELCVYIVARAADGLHYAHERLEPSTGQPLNIVHRDISPQNILVSRDGDVKVTDFGVAKAETQQTKTRAGIVKGKVAYMSPEQCLGEIVDRRTDVFALGIVLYELLTRKRLFRDKSDLLIMQRITGEDVQAPSNVNPDIDEELDAITIASLARPRDERYSSALELSEALDSWLAARGIGDAQGRLHRWILSHASDLAPGLTEQSQPSKPQAPTVTVPRRERPLPQTVVDTAVHEETAATPSLHSSSRKRNPSLDLQVAVGNDTDDGADDGPEAELATQIAPAASAEAVVAPPAPPAPPYVHATPSSPRPAMRPVAIDEKVPLPSYGVAAEGSGAYGRATFPPTFQPTPAAGTAFQQHPHGMPPQYLNQMGNGMPPQGVHAGMFEGHDSSKTRIPVAAGPQDLSQMPIVVLEPVPARRFPIAAVAAGVLALVVVALSALLFLKGESSTPVVDTPPPPLAAASGRLVIETVPPGVDVVIDEGPPVGKSPITVDHAPGKTKVQAAFKGQPPVAVDVNTVASVPTKVRIVARVPLVVKSNPRKVRVFVDGEDKGEAPLEGVFVEAERPLRIRLEGPPPYEPVEETRTALQGTPLIVDATLVKHRGPVAVPVASDREKERELKDQRDQRDKEREKPAALPSNVEVVEYGSISVRTRPWANARVGNERLGPTPFVDAKVPVGPAKLLLVNPELNLRETIPITITKDQTLSVDIVFEQDMKTGTWRVAEKKVRND